MAAAFSCQLSSVSSPDSVSLSSSSSISWAARNIQKLSAVSVAAPAIRRRISCQTVSSAPPSSSVNVKGSLSFISCGSADWSSRFCSKSFQFCIFVFLCSFFFGRKMHVRLPGLFFLIESFRLFLCVVIGFWSSYHLSSSTSSSFLFLVFFYLLLHICINIFICIFYNNTFWAPLAFWVERKRRHFLLTTFWLTEFSFLDQRSRAIFFLV